MASKYFCTALSGSYCSLDPVVATCTTQSGTTVNFTSGGPSPSYNGSTVWYYIGTFGSGGAWNQVKTSGAIVITLTSGFVPGTTCTLSGTPSVSLNGKTLYFCLATTSPTSSDDLYFTVNASPLTVPIIISSVFTCNNMTISFNGSFYAITFVGGLPVIIQVTATITGNLVITGSGTPRTKFTLSGTSKTINQTGFTGTANGISISTTGSISQVSNVVVANIAIAAGTYTNSSYNLTVTPSLYYTPSYYGISVIGGTFNLNSNLDMTPDSNQYGFNVSSGIVNLNSYTLKVNVFKVTGGTINAGTSTIVLQGTFTGFGKTYNNLVMDLSVGVPMIVDSNTFNVISNTTPTVGLDTISPGQGGSIITATTFNFNGTLDVPLQIYDYFYLSSITLTKASGGIVLMKYVSLDLITGSPANTFYASNSTSYDHNNTPAHPNTNTNITFINSGSNAALEFF